MAALIEEFSGAIRSSRPYQPRDRVNAEANVFRLFTLTGAMACGCHPRIIVPLLASQCIWTVNHASPLVRRGEHIEQLRERSESDLVIESEWTQKARSCDGLI